MIGVCPYCKKEVVPGDAIYTITGAHWDCHSKTLPVLTKETRRTAQKISDGVYLEKPEHDTKCPDGFVCYGWRRVNKGGYVRFSGGRHYHENLTEYVGKFVYVTLRDMWGINVDVWINGPFKNPCISTFNENAWKELTTKGI
jgi:hypothetical protein